MFQRMAVVNKDAFVMIKSNDHADCIARHLLEHGTIDTDGFSHTVKVAWRAMALLQTEIEERRQAEEERRKHEEAFTYAA